MQRYRERVDLMPLHFSLLLVGACLIRMLHGAIGDTDFRNGYKKLITRWWVYYWRGDVLCLQWIDGWIVLINSDLLRIDESLTDVSN